MRCQETGICNPIWLDDRSTQTNERGAFKIAAIPRKGVRFDFLKEGYADRRDVELFTDDFRGSDAPNNVYVMAGGAISGTVIDLKDGTVRNFKIRVMIPRDYKGREQVGGYYAGYDWYGISYTNRDGFFNLSGLGAETMTRLIVTSPCVGLAIVDRASSEPLEQLSQATNRTIRLKPFVTLSVRVVAARSKTPVVKGTAALVEDLPDFAQGFRWGYHDLWSERRPIDRAGIALFTEPACDDGTVIVRAPGYGRQRIPWKHGAREVNVAVEPEAVIRGEVQFKGRRLVEGYARLTSAAKDTFAAIDLEETAGQFNFDQLPAGEYELTISRGLQPVLAKRTLTLTPGKVQIENIAISENGSAN
jgi:hypothetical protein